MMKFSLSDSPCILRSILYGSSQENSEKIDLGPHRRVTQGV